MKQKAKLALKLFVLIAIATGVPFAITALYLTKKLETAGGSLLLESVHLLVNERRFIPHQLHHAEKMIALAASKLTASDGLPTFERKAILRNLLTLCPAVSTLTLANKQGELLHMASRNKVLPSEKREHFRRIDFEEARSANTAIVGHPYAHRLSEHMHLPVCLSLWKGQEVAGFITAELSLAPTAELLHSYAFRYDVKTYLLDDTGSIIVKSDKETDGETEKYGDSPSFLRFTKEAASSPEKTHLRLYRNNGARGGIQILAEVPDLPFILLVEQEKNRGLLPYHITLIPVLVGGYLFTLLSGLCLSFLIASMLVKSV